MNYKITVVILFFFIITYNITFAQIKNYSTEIKNSNQSKLTGENDSQTEYFNSHYKDLKDEEGNPILDNLNEPDSLIMTGEAAGNGFGHSVASAGDVNGDGYGDLIVGAYGYNVNVGKVYIFFGGASMDNIADKTFSEAAVFFGHKVASAGDVNGDGYSDILVGTITLGKVYLYYGGANMNTVVDLIFLDAADMSFGNSIASAGNVNGDAYSDIIIGADGYSGLTGRAYIFYGGAPMNNVADVILTGVSANDRFGISVSSAGSVNGDAYSDVIVGAYGYNFSTGRAYIFYGGASMDNTADVILTGEVTNNYFGVSVSGAGDVNKDNYPDVIVGAQGYSGVTGRAYIYYGGSTMNNVADIIMTGEAANNFFGNSVSKAGDVNGDGFSDVIIGAQGYNQNTGRAYVFYGGSPMNNVPDLIMTGEAVADKFGFSVSGAGDLRADGFADFVVGAYDYNSSTGRAYVYMRKPVIGINLKVLMEGMYYTLFNSLARREPVTLYLRNCVSPYSVLDSSQGIVDSISFTTNFTFPNVSTGKYYLVVKHFNSVETWSRSGGDSLKKGVIDNNYDFTTSSSMAYGNNLKLKGTKYCLYSGDVDRNGFVDVGDIVLIYNKSIIFAMGNYLPEDLNADQIVDAADLVICNNNSKNYVGLIRP